MKAQQQLDRSTDTSNGAIEQLPDTLDSPRTKLVYLYLATAGEATVEEVRNTLGMELISLYPVLDTLTSKDLVQKDGSQYVCSNT